jgi:hypothetical protein
MNEELQRLVRIRGAQQRAPKATKETRIALIVAERGLTEKQLAKYFVCARKNCKPRFDHLRFANDQGISMDWLFDGDIRAYPRQSAPHKVRLPARVARERRTHSEAVAHRREFNEAMRQRIRDVAASRDLSDEEIKPVLKLKHQEIAEFTEKHGVNLGWLLEGKGRIFKKDQPDLAAVVATMPRADQQVIEAAVDRLLKERNQ